ncbi:MAG: type II toxin-antitoxin system Phd/YefM family antitoxin [Actinomycetota bacterium]|nr:type II toxin-antitoxin system Phd/YefM family antitoxin [Actinomycetota bacterium]
MAAGRWCATVVAVGIEPLRTVRNHLSAVVDGVDDQHERVVVIRNGRAVAVLISPEDLAQLEGGHRRSQRHRRRGGHPGGRHGVRPGDGLRAVEKVRRLRARRRHRTTNSSRRHLRNGRSRRSCPKLSPSR